eukprot:TRINITY_DN2328_c0_g1_i6.p4 TRINITY_DN2328_c0_g1~~TRINITY_DN2328_c0_g1_i6.p4  ORF type:complete len:109 (-),score=10.40 TRINITY_DN2328_c0_g1_i6:11-337(-)
MVMENEVDWDVDPVLCLVSFVVLSSDFYLEYQKWYQKLRIQKITTNIESGRIGLNIRRWIGKDFFVIVVGIQKKQMTENQKERRKNSLKKNRQEIKKMQKNYIYPNKK